MENSSSSSYRNTTVKTSKKIDYIDEDTDETSDDNNNNETENDDEETISPKKAKPSTWQPTEWSDDVRMNALFAPFRNRDLNPLHYDNKLKFWKELVLIYCRANDCVEIDLRSAEQWFLRKNVKPKCLDLVLSELVKEKRIVSKSDALKPVAQGLIQNVFNRLIWTPLTWSTGYFFRSSPSSSPNQQNTQLFEQNVISSPNSSILANPDRSPNRSYHSASALNTSNTLHTSQSSPSSFSTQSSTSNQATYVVVEILEAKAERLLILLQDRVIHTNVDSVLDYDELADLVSSSISLPLIVRYLEAQKKILVDEHSIPGKRIVKFTLNPSRHVAGNISEIELAFFKLRIEEKKLENDLSRLNSDVDNLNSSIRVYLKQGNKSLALKLLKKRKLIEKSIDSKDGILTNVQTLMMNIQQADTNKLTYDIFSKGVAALKETNKGLSEDKVNETMDDLQDVIETNAEIEETLAKSTGLPNKFNFDENELNAELNELLACSTEENNQEAAENSTFGQTNALDMKEMLESLPDINSFALPNDSQQRNKVKKSSSQLTTN